MKITQAGKHISYKTAIVRCYYCECEVEISREDLYKEEYQKFWLNRYGYTCPNCKSYVGIGVHLYTKLTTPELS